MPDNTATNVSDDTAIWRYMDLARFISMLATNTLWFAKAAEFHDDPWEGFCKVTPRPIPADQYGPGCLTAAQTQGKPVQISIERAAAEISHMSAKYLENARDHLYVNSWCVADESMAMWQIYGASGTGIAIRSSVGRYKRALKPEIDLSQFAFDKVNYHGDPTMNPDLQFDFRRGSIPVPGFSMWAAILKLAFHKRVCFKFEDEWRGALYQDPRPDCRGCNIPVDVRDLIDAVLVGPRDSSFLLGVVESVIQRFGLQKPLAKSDLLEGPQRTGAGDAAAGSDSH